MSTTSTVLMESPFYTDASSFIFNDRNNITEGGLGLRHAIVAHHFWDRPGGGELVMAVLAKVLELAGFKPVIASVFDFDASKYVEWFGVDLTKYSREVLFKIKLKAFGLYSRFLEWVPIKRALDRLDVNIVVIDNGFYKPVVKPLLDKDVRLVEYIHFPIEAYLSQNSRSEAGLRYAEDPYILERYGSFPLSIYWKLFLRLLPLFLRPNPFELASAVLTNSRWTASIVKELYGQEPQVLNPPIAPNVEVVMEPADFFSRENSIIMLGRFSEEKRYHWVVENVLPRLRKEVGELKLYVFGGSRTRTSWRYLSYVEGLANRRGFRVSRTIEADADVYLISDAPRDIIKMAVSRSRVLLHATINEHWGIAVAEAMAGGLPVVVHKSGGTWSDLTLGGQYGLGYSTAEEAVESLARLLTDERLWREYSRRSVDRARELTIDKFMERFLAVLRRIS